jgi:hypothetical protein
VNPKLKVIALIPTLLVTILCLLGDESFGSFVKKAGGTYVFFSVLTVLFGTLWRAALPERPEPQKVKNTEKSGEKPAEPEEKEPETAAAAT